MVIATIAGVTITLPGLLSGAWSALKFAYDLYGQVDLRRTQLKLFLDRCSDLILTVAQSLPASEVDVSARMRENIDHLQATCQSLRDVIDKLKRKGFLWCMLNQDKIDTQIFDVQSRIADTFVLFNLSAHIGIEEFQQRLLQARGQDQAQLITKLDSLSENDQQVLNALKNQDGAQKRVEELLVGVLRCVQNLGTEQSPQARFLRNASAVLQHASKGHIPDISADYVITSLEVDFQDTDSIGQGAFGRVYKGEWNGSRVAIKQMHIDNARILSEDDRKGMYREVRLWTRLHHPNILNLYGACLEATSPFLVMQYCPFGNMRHYLMEHPETNRVDISYDIVAGMIYLHNKGIVHADLKGANILIYKGIALVADFGLSAVIDGIQSRSAQSSMAASVRGTPRWMAPEVHKGEPPTKASDVYSLGLTMWEAFSGKNPYQDVNRYGLIYVIAIENRRPERPARLTENAVWDIIQECWAPVAADRPSVQKVQGKLFPYATRLDSFVRTRSPAPRPRSPTQPTVIHTPPVNMQPPETTSSVVEQKWALSLRSSPLKWTRSNPRNYIDVLTIPEPELHVKSMAEPRELHDYMHRSELKILMLDVRTRVEFNYEHIRGDAVVCIQPSVLFRVSVTGETIEDSLVTVAPRDEWVLFCNRHKFDLIAIYDDASETLGPPNAPLARLMQLIHENASPKILKRVPVLLIGGLQAWKREFGDQELVVEQAPVAPVAPVPITTPRFSPIDYTPKPP